MKSKMKFRIKKIKKKKKLNNKKKHKLRKNIIIKSNLRNDLLNSIIYK